MIGGVAVSVQLDDVISRYIGQIKSLLGNDFGSAVLYGSYARNENTKESDIDIAIFTDVPPKDFYILVDKISGVTFEFNVRYDFILSPVFININEYQRMVKVLPYYQSISKEGVSIG